MTKFFPCARCGFAAWDPPRGVCYACRAMGRAAGPGAFAPQGPCVPGTHVLWLSPDKSLVEAVVLETRGGERHIQLGDGSTVWVQETMLARDVPADVADGDDAGFDLAQGVVDGAGEERDEMELVASIGARCVLPRVRGHAARVSGAVFLRWPAPAPAPRTVPYLDVKRGTVERGHVRFAVRRPDGRVVFAHAFPGRPVIMAAPTTVDADRHVRLRLETGPDGAEGVWYEVWLASGTAPAR